MGDIEAHQLSAQHVIMGDIKAHKLSTHHVIMPILAFTNFIHLADHNYYLCTSVQYSHLRHITIITYVHAYRYHVP